MANHILTTPPEQQIPAAFRPAFNLLGKERRTSVAGGAVTASAAGHAGPLSAAASTPAGRRGNLRPLAALATLGVLSAAYFPLLAQYGVELQMAGSAVYAAVLGLASLLLLYRAGRGPAVLSNGFRAAATLFAALLVLGLALAGAAPWLAAVSAWLALVAIVDRWGGSRLLRAAWHLLLVGALSILLPLAFVRLGIERANHFLLRAGRTLLEQWGTICLIDGDVLELHHGRLDPGQGYFNLNLALAIVAACLVYANLRRRGPIHSLILATLGLVWLWLVCVVQVVVFAWVIEGGLPLANEPATLVPITIAAAAALVVLLLSTDRALELFPQLIFNAGAAIPVEMTPAVAPLPTQPGAARSFDTARVARLLWGGLLLLNGAMAIEQFAFDGHYLAASRVVATDAEGLICDRNLLPDRWGDWRCTSFRRHRDASCLGRTAVLPTWQYETPRDVITVSLFLSQVNRSDEPTHEPAGDARAEATSGPDADADKSEPVFAWQSIAIEQRREATLLTLTAPLKPIGDFESQRPNDYLAAYCPRALADWVACRCNLQGNEPRCLSMLLRAYHAVDVAEDSRVHGFFRTVLASARAAHERAEVLP